MDETQRSARGHRFTPPKKILKRIPPLYATEGAAAENKQIWLHYFSAGTDLYVAELEQREEDGHWIAFGYSILASQPEGQEWGYTDLTELEAVNARSRQGLPLLVERDCHWTPQPFRDVVETPAAEPAPEPEAQDREPTPAMICPECEEIAVNSPATDLVPWQAHGLETPQWSHRDGSALCPVIGPSGGYQPAQPQQHQGEPGADTARLDPPATMQSRERPIGDFPCCAAPAGEQEHQAGDAYVCGFPNREGDGFDQVVSYAEELEARATDLPDPVAERELLERGRVSLEAAVDKAPPAEVLAGLEPGTADEAFVRGWSPDGGRHGLFALGQGVIIDDGPTGRQLNNWNIANDHAEDGADLDDDLDYEAE